MLGGGPVGSELAQAWSTLGTKVTLVEGEERLLPREEPFAGEQVAAALRERYGIDVRTGVLAERVSPRRRRDRGRAERRQPVEAAELLVAVGRKPRTEGDRPRLGRRRARRARLPRDRRRGCGSAAATGSTRSATSTAAPSSPTWASTRPGSRPRTSSAARSRRSPKASARPASPSPTPRSPRSARRSPRPTRPASTRKRSTSPPTAPPAPASRARNTGGTSRLVVDQDKQTIVGATFTGFETADFLHAATVAIVGEVPLRPPPPRRRRLPDPQRDLAQAAGAVRALASRADTAATRPGRNRAKPASAASGLPRTRAASPESRRVRRPTGSGRGARGGRAGGSPG